jgi:beta-lactamase superfamily II metal-dependent hydrolase
VWQRAAPPADDELEVSVLGPGYGEAIAIHFGKGQWATIDSCVDDNGSCTTVSYLRSLGIDPQQVKFAIATHWHADHIRGLADILRWANSADFWCPSVFVDADFLDFAASYAEEDLSVLGAASSDLAQVFDLLDERGQLPKVAHQDTTIFSDPTAAVHIYALSPTQSRVNQFLKRIASHLPKLKDARLRVPDLHPNLVSLVLRFVVGPNAAILGADLQERPYKGWTEVLDTSQCLTGSAASIFKIPHHGSENAYLEPQFTELLTPDPYLVLTPYNRGSQRLPTSSDVARILGHSAHTYSSARVGSVAPKKFDRAIEKSLEEGNIELRSSEIKMGHVQFRKKIDDAASGWKPVLFGNAIRLV